MAGGPCMADDFPLGHAGRKHTHNFKGYFMTSVLGRALGGLRIHAVPAFSIRVAHSPRKRDTDCYNKDRTPFHHPPPLLNCATTRTRLHLLVVLPQAYKRRARDKSTTNRRNRPL